MFSKGFEDFIRRDPEMAAARVFTELVNDNRLRDGNNRTSFLIMNYVLLKAGLPTVFLTPANVGEYRRLRYRNRYGDNGTIKSNEVKNSYTKPSRPNGCA